MVGHLLLGLSGFGRIAVLSPFRPLMPALSFLLTEKPPTHLGTGARSRPRGTTQVPTSTLSGRTLVSAVTGTARLPLLAPIHGGFGGSGSGATFRRFRRRLLTFGRLSEGFCALLLPFHAFPEALRFFSRLAEPRQAVKGNFGSTTARRHPRVGSAHPDSGEGRRRSGVPQAWHGEKCATVRPGEVTRVRHFAGRPENLRASLSPLLSTLPGPAGGGRLSLSIARPKPLHNEDTCRRPGLRL